MSYLDMTESLGYFQSQGGGWRDLIGAITVKGVGVNDPSWAQIGSSKHYGYKFGLNDEVWTEFHIDHDYSPNTDIYLHCHWFVYGSDANVVKWASNYTMAKGHSQQAFNFTGTDVSVTLAPAGNSFHMISEIADDDAFPASEPDTMILVHHQRVTAAPATNNAADVFLKYIDCHYQADRFSTLNKSPDFYS